MSYRSLALTVAVLSSTYVASADAQSVYVAPGGVYIGAGPVYVIPAPNNGAAPYVASTYGRPAVLARPRVVVAPTAVYGPNGDYYNDTVYGPNGDYYSDTVYGPNGGYYEAPISAYAAELPRPPAAIPYRANRLCAVRYGYGHRLQRCY